MASLVPLLVLLSLLQLSSPLKVFHTPLGHQGKFHCLSLDDHHLFQFWQVPGNLLGPGLSSDPHKYKYQVLTGDLEINNVEPKDHGVYTCYTKNIVNNTFRMESFELDVGEEFHEDQESPTDALQMLIMAISLTIILACLFVMYVEKEHVLSLISSRDSAQEEVEDKDEEQMFLPEAIEMSTSPIDTELPPRLSNIRP